MSPFPARLLDLRYSVAALRAPDRLELANGGIRTVNDDVVIAKGVVPFLHIATFLSEGCCCAPVLLQSETSAKIFIWDCRIHETLVLAV